MRKRWSSCRLTWMPLSKITPSSSLWPHPSDKVRGSRHLHGFWKDPQRCHPTVAGNQPAESDNAPIEGSVETSHLLEQVRYVAKWMPRHISPARRSMPSVAR